MIQEVFDIVIPLYQVRWNTRAVLEGLAVQYKPRAIHIIAPAPQARSLAEMAQEWDVGVLYTHEEEIFFETVGLTKNRICEEIDLGQSLYNPGWFYQQLLKLGAWEGIEDLSEWYLVWDSDLLPVDVWDAIAKKDNQIQHSFALLQDNSYGNPGIVGKWEVWINKVLGVEAITDSEGTFIPHHMWFKQEYLKSFTHQVNQYFASTEHWLLLMMRSANQFGTFSEYWSYVSWVNKHAPQDLSFYPYNRYGKTTERFFDDGTGLFSAALRRHQRSQEDIELVPSYAEIIAFIKEQYGEDPLPSSLSFESSPRHLKKNRENMHIEELRSRWNPRENEEGDRDAA